MRNPVSSETRDTPVLILDDSPTVPTVADDTIPPPPKPDRVFFSTHGPIGLLSGTGEPTEDVRRVVLECLSSSKLARFKTHFLDASDLLHPLVWSDLVIPDPKTTGHLHWEQKTESRRFR